MVVLRPERMFLTFLLTVPGLIIHPDTCKTHPQRALVYRIVHTKVKTLPKEKRGDAAKVKTRELHLSENKAKREKLFS